MTRKALIYIALERRAVFLFAINLSSSIGFGKFNVFKYLIRFSVFALMLLSSVNFESYAQNSCPSGQRVCIDGECHPARECRPTGNPPPPGLPIDSKLPFLIIAGLGLGIYYLRSRKEA